MWPGLMARADRGVRGRAAGRRSLYDNNLDGTLPAQWSAMQAMAYLCGPRPNHRAKLLGRAGGWCPRTVMGGWCMM